MKSTLLRSATHSILIIASVLLWVLSWRQLRQSLCAGEQLMGGAGTAFLINDAAFALYLGGVLSATLALGLFAIGRRIWVRWMVLFSSMPVAFIAFVLVSEAAAESWYVCAH